MFLVGRAGCLLTLNREQEALADLDRAIEDRPRMIQARKMRASIYVRLRTSERAIRDVDAITKITPRDSVAWSMLANLYYQADDFVHGDVALEQARKLAPESAAVLSALGLRHVRQGNAEAALPIYDKLVLQLPHQPNIWRQRGNILVTVQGERIADLSIGVHKTAHAQAAIGL